jgi:glycerate 2-kinase
MLPQPAAAATGRLWWEWRVCQDPRVRVLVAPDSLGGALPAHRAAPAIADGWRRAAPADDVRTCPLSGGGPGFLEAVRATLGGELLSVTVRSPLGTPVPATVLVATDERGHRTAWVESTQATGLSLVPVDRRDPTRTSSAGVGDLLALALGTGARRVVVGVGEGAVHDAGAGMLAALGVGAATPRDDGHVLGGGGGGLGGATATDLAGLDRLRDRWAGVDLVAACDADLPLLGLHGASASAAGSRGATPHQAQDLERALGSFAHAAVAALGPRAVRPDLLAGGRPTAPVTRLTGTPGAGAGGGLGFGLSLLGGRVLPGPAVVADLLGVPARLADVDLVVTGEGRVDGRSLHDRVCAVVAQAALGAGIPTVVLAGRVEAGRRELAAAGIAAAYAVDDGLTADAGWWDDAGDHVDGVGSGARAGDPARVLADRAERVARTWSRPGGR